MIVYSDSYHISALWFSNIQEGDVKRWAEPKGEYIRLPGGCLEGLPEWSDGGVRLGDKEQGNIMRVKYS